MKIINKVTKENIAHIITNRSMTIDEAIEIAGGEIIGDTNDERYDDMDNENVIFGDQRYCYDEIDIIDDDSVINDYGSEITFAVAVSLMDDEIREELHREIAPCTDQEFFDAYCAAHEAKCGEEFECAKRNPCV